MKAILPALRVFLFLTIITGIVYPLLITGIAQAAFGHAANGSLIKVDGKTVGSSLVGQPFDDPKYFWSRPSATGPFPYNAQASSGSNMGPTNPALAKAITDRVAALQKADPSNKDAVPTDLVTASGSGLDPHISIAAAECQVSRVAKARGLDEAKVRELVTAHTTGPTFGVLGEGVVNVLELNLDLDKKP